MTDSITEIFNNSNQRRKKNKTCEVNDTAAAVVVFFGTHATYNLCCLRSDRLTITVYL